MSWLAGKSEFQSSLGIGNSSLSRDTLAISTEQIQSEPHRLWASGKWKEGEGSSVQKMPRWEAAHQAGCSWTDHTKLSQ